MVTRRKLEKLFLASTFAAFLLAAGPALANENPEPFRNIDNGEPRTLDDFREEDKWLVVMIWASDCPVCNREASHYSDFHMLHADDDAKILGVSVDGWEGRDDARAFVDRHLLMFDNVVADFGDLVRWYERAAGTRWLGTPTFMIYDPEGILKARQAGAVPVHLIEQFIASH